MTTMTMHPGPAPISSNLAIWSTEARKTALTFKRLSTSYRRHGGKTTGSVSVFTVSSAALDFYTAARRAARIALDLKGWRES
jgi:hypothetical protein